jgi:peptidyl-prolyl cis-trans isomerase A (cyclophilin A)
MESDYICNGRSYLRPWFGGHAATGRRKVIVPRLRGWIAVCAATLALVSAWGPGARAAPVRVLMRTEAGPILIELYPDAAPITAGNFLAYVDKGLLAGGAFYRSVGPANDHNPARITVLQGGRDDAPGGLPPIAHETTAATGLRHTDGVISMARDAPGSATSEFFISIGDNPALDFGGARNADGQGFAAFGRVISGMRVVRKIHAAPTRASADNPYLAGQLLAAPVRILGAERR